MFELVVIGVRIGGGSGKLEMRCSGENALRNHIGARGRVLWYVLGNFI